MDILDIIFEARVNDVATLSEEDKTNTPYHSNGSAAYKKMFSNIPEHDLTLEIISRVGNCS